MVDIPPGRSRAAFCGYVKMKKKMESIHGGDIYRNLVKYDFSVNVNPFGMPHACVEAAKRGVEAAAHYPDVKAERLVRGIASKEGVSAENILVGNGAAELLFAFCNHLRLMGMLKGKRVLLPVPCFAEYERAVAAAGGVCEYFPLREENKFLLEETFLSAITEEIALVILCNPNNPTGQLLPEGLLLRVAKRCKEVGAYLLADECFLEFVPGGEEMSAKYLLLSEGCGGVQTFAGKMSTNGWHSQESRDVASASSRVYILKAFTKIYCMPGLRLGYLIGDAAFLKGVSAQLQPWNTSIPAQLAGEAALGEVEYLKKSVAFVVAERAWMMKELQRRIGRGVLKKVYPSHANFILLLAMGDLGERLLEKGILVRDCSNYPNLDKGYFRIAVRTHAENEALLQAIDDLAQENT